MARYGLLNAAPRTLVLVQTAMVTEPRAGEILDGRFEIAQPIGRGGTGSVFKATDLTIGAAVEVTMPFDVDSDPAVTSRFSRDIEIARLLDHPGIRKIVAAGNPGRPYFVTECVEGETLRDRLQQVRTLPVNEALRIATLIGDVLEYIHRHDVVHRRLQPASVMLCGDGSVRILDLGMAIAAMAGAVRRLTVAGLFRQLGTPHYLAPEQVRGQRGDARVDVYSLGAILYEMTTGHAPYDEQPDLYSVMNARLAGDPVAPRVHDPAIAPTVEEIILRALARDTDRYQSAAALRGELAAPERVPVTGRASRLRVPLLEAVAGV
jgi:serine/threonine protein kinase